MGENVEGRDVGSQNNDAAEQNGQLRVRHGTLSDTATHPFSPLRIDLTTSLTPRFRCRDLDAGFEGAVQNVSRGAENGGDVTTSSEPAGLSRHA